MKLRPLFARRFDAARCDALRGAAGARLRALLGAAFARRRKPLRATWRPLLRHAADDEPIARLDLLDRRPWELSPDEFGEIARLVPDDMWAAMDAAGDALGSASDRAAP